MFKKYVYFQGGCNCATKAEKGPRGSRECGSCWNESSAVARMEYISPPTK